MDVSAGIDHPERLGIVKTVRFAGRVSSCPFKSLNR
jgi:hypothetical protein